MVSMIKMSLVYDESNDKDQKDIDNDDDEAKRKRTFPPSFSDLSGRSEFAEEKLRKTSEELEKAKESREQMYERYVLSREEVKTQYEERLQVKDFLWISYTKWSIRKLTQAKAMVFISCSPHRLRAAALRLSR